MLALTLSGLVACGNSSPAPAPAINLSGGFGLPSEGDVVGGQPTDAGTSGQQGDASAQSQSDAATVPSPGGDGGSPGDAGSGSGAATSDASAGTDTVATGADAGAPPKDSGASGVSCVDKDKDGFGKGCPAGSDCDDNNPNFSTVCPDCSKQNHPGCPCNTGAANCYSGEPKWIGKGACQAGVQLCKAGFWGPCSGEVLPTPEACNTKDDNCNGLVDEGVLSTCGTCDMSCTQQKLGPGSGTPFDPSTASSNGVGVDKNGFVVLDKSKVNVDLNHIWVANSSQATVSKVNTKTGWEVGRYKICGNPSRTSVDLNGDVWVGCRSGGGVAKIINSAKNCTDKNGNGKIDTSKDANGDHIISANEMVANDECVQFIVKPGGNVARAAGVDKDNHAWIGFWSKQMLYRLEPTAGKTVASVKLPCRPYGLVIDQKGIVWVQGAGCGLVRVDPKTKQVKKFTPPFKYHAYGINVDMFGNIWFGGGWGAVRYDPVKNTWFKAPGVKSSSAVATGMDGFTYVVNDGPSTVTKIHSLTGAPQGTISLGSGRGPHGVALDYDGYVWAVNLSKSTVSKVSPTLMKVVGEYPVGKGPYTYSDMTGYTLNNFTAPKGHYTHVFGFGTWSGQVSEAKTTTVWSQIHAEVETPKGAYVKVRYRAADSIKLLEKALWSKELGPFPVLTFPIDLTKKGQVKARYLQVELFLQAASKTKLSPKIKSLSAKGKQVFIP
ncbi:MAG: hypothetical protein KC502_08650 [Myxococcales bacterium]|nr:hypothetical protein [Myxococcales bacterium]